MQKHHLILGGARSGKSSFAEQQVKSLVKNSDSDGIDSNSLHYIATAICFDDEMQQRIKHHQARRGVEWQEHEVPVQLAKKLSEFDEQDVVLIDCLTLWLNNIIFELGDEATNQQVEAEVEKLTYAVETCSAQLVMVSNEVGLGIVPLGKVSRLFVDNAGRMNQALARVCSQVTFVAAGLPIALKNER